MTTITHDFFIGASLPSRSRRAAADQDWSQKREPDNVASSAHSTGSNEIARIAHECSFEGWDGYTATPISKSVRDRALAFLNALPAWIAAPDIVPEADGEIAIEWYFAPDRTFSISIGPRGPLHYAGIFGPQEEAHGLAPFTDTIPESIHKHISALLRRADASFAA